MLLLVRLGLTLVRGVKIGLSGNEQERKVMIM